ncbi:unnamed protein product [Medioppia subpectinata]|uniref:Rho GDP-dissociation inhibitor 3 n=1 Tax=Medioppia subpectinata TaxID=1979941 RepID=A0A7R9KSY7_9ACAR|nr:unnamed protein product [Medioppia subpectinata]CAG2108939.1 unnamed protein product [Medioppia subpectinata]
MSDTPVADHEVSEEDTNYRPPPEKSLDEIVNADKEDESLQKYKQTLLGAAAADVVVVDGDNPNRVIVKNLVLVVDGRPDVVLDLSPGNLEAVKKNVFVIKEGIQYKIRIEFIVQREIVTGLKYQQKISRHSIQVEKMNQMVGSYAPKHEMQSYTSPMEEMPSGLLSRGTYHVTSLFTDDDNHEWLKWDWNFELKKNW